MKKPLVIFHANCRDGMCSAAIMYDYLMGECELHPMQYGDTLKAPIKNREIIMVDFSLPRHDLIQVATEAASVLILDHHESAAEHLVDLPHNVSFVYQTYLSGAGITWQHCYQDARMPMIVRYVQDRDLWKFEYHSSKAVNEALAANYPTIEHWIEDWFALQDDAFVDSVLAPQGEAILMTIEQQVSRIQQNVVHGDIDGTPVVVCNSPILQSELGNSLANKHQKPAIIWHLKNKEECVLSIRSLDNLSPARSLAEHFGGGGHRNAAGCAFNPSEITSDLFGANL